MRGSDTRPVSQTVVFRDNLVTEVCWTPAPAYQNYRTSFSCDAIGRRIAVADTNGPSDFQFPLSGSSTQDFFDVLT